MIVVQIGTNTASWESNGQIYFDPCLEFVKKNQDQIEFLHLIEPISDCLPSIEQSYSFFKRKKIHSVAITNDPAQTQLEIFVPKNHKTSGHSSNNRNHLLSLGHNDIVSIIVPCFTLNDFLNLNSIDKCDMLFIDTEGLDCLILLNYDFDKYKTNFIEFEVVHADGYMTQSTNAEKCLSRLISNGFNIEKSPNDDLNLIARR
jgi:FkbM family methyltransferase